MKTIEVLKQLRKKIKEMAGKGAWDDIEALLNEMSDEEQFQLDVDIRFGNLTLNGRLVFPYRNGKYFNDGPKEHAKWIPNRSVQLDDVDGLLNLRAIEKKDNYCVCNILAPDSTSRYISDVTHINELFIDIDLGHNLDGAKRSILLKKVRIRLEELFEQEKLPRPTTFCFSGRGFAMHFILVLPIKSDSEEAVKFAALYQCAFDYLEDLFSDMKDEAVDIDRSVCSLNRLSRMMGSCNTKAGDKYARFITVSEHYFTLDELIQAFVTDPVDFQLRCKMKAEGRRITKAEMTKVYARLARKAEKEAKKYEQLPEKSRKKLSDSEGKIKRYRDDDSCPSVEYDPARAHRARYALMKLDKFFDTRKWVDGDKRSEFAFVVYNCARTLYTQDKAEFILCDYNERMEDPLDKESLDRIIESAEEQIYAGGKTYLPSYETLIERLQMDRQIACDLGLCADEWERQRDEHIATAYDRDVMIMELYREGYSYGEIAEMVKEKYPDSDISKTTAYRRVQKLKDANFSTMKRTIYAEYQLGDMPRKPKGWFLPFQHFYDDDKTNNINKMQRDDLGNVNTTSVKENNSVLKRVTLEQDVELKQMILTDLLSKKDVMIFGAGGTGKTYTIQQFLKQSKTKVAIVAPTGVASSNIPGGITIHKFLGINEKTDLLTPPTVPPSQLLEIETVIVDELSLVRADLFDYLERNIQLAEKKTGKHIQRVFLLDVGQIPPVVPDEEKKRLSYWYASTKYMFFDSKTFKQLHLKYYRCDYNHRAEAEEREFADKLYQIHDYDTSAIPYFNSRVTPFNELPNDGVYLAARNRDVESYNAYKINQHLSDPSLCYAEAEYQSDIESKSVTFDVETQIPLFIGMPVMTIRNKMEKENGYVNGTRGKITKINKKSIVIQKADGTTLRIEKEEFTAKESDTIRIKQYPIRVSYGISINKCQGLTFECPVIINPYCFESGQLYTALSRVRRLSNLYLTDKIPESSLIPNPEADAFMNSIELITAENMHLYASEYDNEV